MDEFDVDDRLLEQVVNMATLAMEYGEVLASREETLEFAFAGLIAGKRWPPGLKHAKEPKTLRKA